MVPTVDLSFLLALLVSPVFWLVAAALVLVGLTVRRLFGGRVSYHTFVFFFFMLGGVANSAGEHPWVAAVAFVAAGTMLREVVAGANAVVQRWRRLHASRTT